MFSPLTCLNQNCFRFYLYVFDGFATFVTQIEKKHHQFLVAFQKFSTYREHVECSLHVEALSYSEKWLIVQMNN